MGEPRDDLVAKTRVYVNKKIKCCISTNLPMVLSASKSGVSQPQREIILEKLNQFVSEDQGWVWDQSQSKDYINVLLPDSEFQSLKINEEPKKKKHNNQQMLAQVEAEELKEGEILH